MAEHWRTGKRVLRTLYIHQGDDETGVFIGAVDTPELAAAICNAMNRPTEQQIRVQTLRDYATWLEGFVHTSLPAPGAWTEESWVELVREIADDAENGEWPRTNTKETPDEA